MSDIQIMEKPDWVSWDDIHEVLWKAHAQNREKGIVMSYPSLSGSEIQKMIGADGKMFVAIDKEKMIGTLALIKKTGNKWYNKGDYGYLCLGAVLQEYGGKGVYRSLYQLAEKSAMDAGLVVLIRQTNEHNARMLKITKTEGYRYVEMKACKDHYNIVRAKWLKVCPYDIWYINARFQLSKLMMKIRYRMDPVKGKIKRFGF